MARRVIINSTGIPRIPDVPYHHAWCSYTCLKCQSRNYELIGLTLLEPADAYLNCKWVCSECSYIHSKNSKLPFKNWPADSIDKNSLHTERYWQAFFRSATENSLAYWKICNVCGRVLPNMDFSRHANWGPLEKQMECRSCKAAINAELNKLRTTEQLRESANRRRIAELLMKDEDEKLDLKKLFTMFGGRCFKTKVKLDFNDKKSWQIDHTLPARYFYPLSEKNATLLSLGANQNKSDKWPSKYYTHTELVELAKITGADLALLASKSPIINNHIDVDRCVDKFLNVRSGSDLEKRIAQLKYLLTKNELIGKLSEKNKAILGFNKGSK
jgi:hypothetical protein